MLTFIVKLYPFLEGGLALSHPKFLLSWFQYKCFWALKIYVIRNCALDSFLLLITFLKLNFESAPAEFKLLYLFYFLHKEPIIDKNKAARQLKVAKWEQ